MKILPNDTTRVKRSSNRNVNVTLLELVRQDRELVERRGEYWCPCPFHQENTPSFSVNPEKGVYYCFGCGATGDAIDYLRKARGLSFREAAAMVGKELPPLERRQRKLSAAAREKQLERYYGWWHEKLKAWTELLDEIFFAEVAYRALNRAPNLYTMEEHEYWTKRLGDLYFRQSVSQQLMDLTDAERWKAWRQEAGEK